MSKIACSHCGLEFSEDVMIKDGNHHFCCNGCQGVYHLLSDEGLENFYARKGDTKLTQQKNINYENSEKFDLDSFKKRYIKTTPDGFNSINLIIEGIHCSACVWLNEKVLNQMEGILQADINFSTHKAKIVWDDEVVKLSDIIEKVRSIGYNAYPYDVTTNETNTNTKRKDYYIRLIVAVFGSMNIMTLAIAKYGGWFTGMQSDIEQILKIAEFVIATPVLFYSGWIYFKGAYYALKNRYINMDFLVASGATLTYLYSIYSLFSPTAHSYFDSVVMIITFISIGKFLEVISQKSIIDQLDTLTNQIPDTVMVIKDTQKILTPSIEVEVGDIIEIKSGEKAVIDGEIIQGEGSFDESSLTGEATPVYKRQGDSLISGTMLLDSTLRYKATKRYEDSTLATLITLTHDAMSKKPRIEGITNQISGWFSLVILALALLTFIGWYANSADFELSFIVGVSVIVIACPCALALATPIASLVGIGSATKNNLIFKKSSDLETMNNINVLILDKTGTITEGNPSVIDFHENESFDINLLYSLVKQSTHPISKGVARYLEKLHEELKEYPLEEIKLIEAKGIQATYNSTKIVGGNKRFLEESGIQVDAIESATQFLFAVDGVLFVEITLEDMIKDGAKELISYAKDSNIQTVMLTGDNANSARKIADEIGIDEFHSSLLPTQKAEFVKSLKEAGKTVMMVGDGINDSIALSNADIAIAMGNSADIAIEVSDIIVLDNSLKSLTNGFIISKRTFSNIKQNLLISLIYNLVTIPLAVLGYVIPMVAALSMSLSSLLVVANSFRIKLKRLD